MKNDYIDIEEKLGRPLWWDMHGVPRYVDFDPSNATVYSNYVALTTIKCQACGKFFIVAATASSYDGEIVFPTKIDEGSFGYGDPPVHGCSGDTMMSTPVMIIQFWERKSLEWSRNKELEFDYDEVNDLWGCLTLY